VVVVLVAVEAQGVIVSQQACLLLLELRIPSQLVLVEPLVLEEVIKEALEITQYFHQ
jgi:hypothetical protein